MGLRFRFGFRLRGSERDHIELAPGRRAAGEEAYVTVGFEKGTWQYKVLQEMKTRGYSVRKGFEKVIDEELRKAAALMGLTLE